MIDLKAYGAPVGGHVRFKEILTVPVHGQVPEKVTTPDRVALSSTVSSVSLSSQAMAENITDKSDNASSVLKGFIDITPYLLLRYGFC